MGGFFLFGGLGGMGLICYMKYPILILANPTIEGCEFESIFWGYEC